ncbi:MAG: hypothetical protein ACTSWD_04740 [Candidatus Heimdallarchaeota archaeon]
MATYDSIEAAVEKCLDILSPHTCTYDDSKTLQEHVIEIADCMKDLNDLVRDLDDRVKDLEEI